MSGKSFKVKTADGEVWEWDIHTAEDDDEKEKLLKKDTVEWNQGAVLLFGFGLLLCFVGFVTLLISIALLFSGPPAVGGLVAGAILLGAGFITITPSAIYLVRDPDEKYRKGRKDRSESVAIILPAPEFKKNTVASKPQDPSKEDRYLLAAQRLADLLEEPEKEENAISKAAWTPVATPRGSPTFESPAAFSSATLTVPNPTAASVRGSPRVIRRVNSSSIKKTSSDPAPLEFSALPSSDAIFVPPTSNEVPESMQISINDPKSPSPTLSAPPAVFQETSYSYTIETVEFVGNANRSTKEPESDRKPTAPFVFPEPVPEKMAAPLTYEEIPSMDLDLESHSLYSPVAPAAAAAAVAPESVTLEAEAIPPKLLSSRASVVEISPEPITGSAEAAPSVNELLPPLEVESVANQLVAEAMLSAEATPIAETSPLSDLLAKNVLLADTISIAETSPVAERKLVAEAAHIAETSPISELLAVNVLLADTTPIAETSPIAESELVAEAAAIAETSPLSDLLAENVLFADTTPIAETSPVAESELVAEAAPIAEKSPLSDLLAENVLLAEETSVAQMSPVAVLEAESISPSAEKLSVSETSPVTDSGPENLAHPSAPLFAEISPTLKPTVEANSISIDTEREINDSEGAEAIPEGLDAVSSSETLLSLSDTYRVKVAAPRTAPSVVEFKEEDEDLKQFLLSIKKQKAIIP